MKKFVTLVLASILSAACGGGASPGAGAQKLDVKVGGKESALNVKSGAVYYGNIISTAPGKPDIQTFAHTIYIANFEMDTSGPGWTRKPLTAPDQMRVEIQLTGEDATNTDSPFKVATYTAKADKFNSVRYVAIRTFADGKETKTEMDTSFNKEKINGEVKITSVTADSITGEVNLAEGDKSIKGAFTAKLPKAK